MARLLLFFVHADHRTGAGAAVSPLVQLLLVALVVAAVVVSLCTSGTHAKLWRRDGPAPVAEAAESDNRGVSSRKHMLAASLSGIGGKAARMVSWNRRSPSPGSSSDDDEEEVAAVEDEEAVWRKAIIMGDKCRPLQFSGHIAFDSDGNLLPPAPAKKATADDAAQN